MIIVVIAEKHAKPKDFCTNEQKKKGKIINFLSLGSIREKFCLVFCNK